MRIVIDISEDIREQLLDICNFGLEIPLGLQNKMIMAITNGIVLPEGHGRLIDADEALKAKIKHELDTYRYAYPIYAEQVNTNNMIDIFTSILDEAIEDLEEAKNEIQGD